MKKLLIVTFDLIRSCDSPVSLAAGYLLSSLKADPSYGRDYTIKHCSLNLLSQGRITTQTALNEICNTVDLLEMDYIAISCYIWCNYLINDLMIGFRERGFRGKLVVGGYQIHPEIEVMDLYPDADIYISGYAEWALKMLVSSEIPFGKRSLLFKPDLNSMPSPYLDGTIPVNENQSKVRIETKRGCPFSCSFCGHRDLCYGIVYYHPVDKVKKELDYLVDKRPKKINIIDPVFNFGKGYLSILKYCLNDLKLDILISLQVSIELLYERDEVRFLEYCSKLNIVLEIGLESIHREELYVLNKNTDIDYVHNIFSKLRDMETSFEVNLIYGLPNQTVESFVQSIKWLQDQGCDAINCYPLMLLPGTQLYSEASYWELKVEKKGPLDLPLVVRSNTFSEDDWERMNELAEITNKG